MAVTVNNFVISFFLFSVKRMLDTLCESSARIKRQGLFGFLNGNNFENVVLCKLLIALQGSIGGNETLTFPLLKHRCMHMASRAEIYHLNREKYIQKLQR